MNFKYLNKLIAFSGLIFFGCDFQDIDSPYQEQISVYANLQANLPMIDTVYVSRTAEIGEEVDAVILGMLSIFLGLVGGIIIFLGIKKQKFTIIMAVS